MHSHAQICSPHSCWGLEVRSSGLCIELSYPLNLPCPPPCNFIHSSSSPGETCHYHHVQLQKQRQRFRNCFTGSKTELFFSLGVALHVFHRAVGFCWSLKVLITAATPNGKNVHFSLVLSKKSLVCKQKSEPQSIANISFVEIGDRDFLKSQKNK